MRKIDFAKLVFNNWLTKLRIAAIKLSGGVACKGVYKFIVTNKVTGKQREYVYENLVPTIGRAAIADQIAGVNSAELEAISVEIGTGTTAPANGDTAMETPTNRKAILSAATSSNVATVSTNFTVGDLALGGTTIFREAGIIADGSAVTTQAAVVGGTGILLSRVAINVSVTVVEALTVEFTFTIT